MRINKDSLKARANNISTKLGISQNIVYNRFFFDAFLARLSISQYQDKFVLKGGLYLSSVLGIETRSTMDMDFYIKFLSMEKENIVNLIKNIADIDIGDGVAFKVLGCSNIRPDDQYGGFQVKILSKLDNVRYEFTIDVATGDPIVPSERNYDYKCLVTGETLPIKAYSLESVIAEKLETVLVRQIANSRSKDFYDLYILRKTQLDYVDKDFLRKAFEETCEYRGFNISKENALSLLDEIKRNVQMNNRWNSYVKSAKYADGLTFEEVINLVIEWINETVK
ncbi:MAG: nucleotidyl transferase AbiEii/AbiGii toxin family protein [Bacilli bacterium]|nr:nucleotidyl transferase AbiEii/AbiGii toxin family protein [Bacilli bacterium]